MRSAAFFSALALAGCATTQAVQPVNAPRGAAAEAQPVQAQADTLVLALSGGGARAAAFSLGVLQGLREMRGADGKPLTDHIALITSVSGGSITAAYFGQHGDAGLDTFRAAYLDEDWGADIHDSPASPLNWFRAYTGGLNGPDRLADWLDAHVFAGGRMRDLPRSDGPRIWINATELHTETPFAFTPFYFDALCSDLGGVRIADSVAASMAVPLAFRPIVVGSYADSCDAPLPAWVQTTTRGDSVLQRTTAQAFTAYRDPQRMRYLHLVDGGVLDNFGLSSLILARRTASTPYAPFSEESAVRLHRALFLVVNAEKSRVESWPLEAKGPSGAQVMGAVFDAQVDFSKREAYDTFMDVARAWRDELVSWRCSLSPDEVARWRGGLDGWKCDDLSFTVDMISFADLPPSRFAELSAAPTRVTLPKPLIDDLIAGGRDAVTQNAATQALTR